MSRELTEKEAKAMRLTSELWSTLLEIEREHSMHPDDIHEHRRDIHDIQNRILSRNSLVVIEKNFNK